jgi:hypothetical protein
LKTLLIDNPNHNLGLRISLTIEKSEPFLVCFGNAIPDEDFLGYLNIIELIIDIINGNIYCILIYKNDRSVYPKISVYYLKDDMDAFRKNINEISKPLKWYKRSFTEFKGKIEIFNWYSYKTVNR